MQIICDVYLFFSSILILITKHQLKIYPSIDIYQLYTIYFTITKACEGLKNSNVRN